MYGVRSKDGVVTVARNLKEARFWIEYEYRTVVGNVMEELVRFNGAEWVKYPLDIPAEVN